MWSIISPRMKCELRFSLGGSGSDSKSVDSFDMVEESVGM
jgi:hypothetical protein